ncbi:hypothetical protein Poli38472_007887 [Pythium oligandrum]|uniref:Peptidase M48 domain-containing protein n=1 Tax=Pythium oligandrum TaxID=41045 RepID=A0A8K1CRI3_PYTOL|nr:hypothetical protein Poli38472_007887 [Pythium oligandrum]|eukprot:TMW68215.1 hypothetical protein Poli38472_007887 [Pythium oligandrum]
MARRLTWREEWRTTPPYLRALMLGTASVGGLYVASHVETMPLTGRRRVMFLSHLSEERLGERAAQEIMHSERILPASHPMSRAVSRIGHKIAEQSDNPHMKWQFHVIESHEPNAFCLPGGKVFVNTGLFKILHNEDALAAVLFHEAAHGLARHGAEKISFSLLVYGLLAFFLPDYGQFSDLLVKLAVDLPFSRKLELEADSIGLRLMAKACYDPRASIHMNNALGKIEKKNPAARFKYFSTHPPSKERVQALRDQLRDAMEIYEASDCYDRKQAFHTVFVPEIVKPDVW